MIHDKFSDDRSPAQQMPVVHVFFSNLGGSGKTFAAALMADYLRSKGNQVRCFDGDPVLGGLAHYEALQAERLVWDGMNDVRAKRELERVFEPGDESAIRILDCGPSAFFPFCAFVAKARLRERPNWYLHFMLPVDRLHEASLRWADPAKRLPFVFWLTHCGPYRPSIDDARTEARTRLLIEESHVQWIDFGAKVDDIRMVFRERKTLSEYTNSSDFLIQIRARRIQEKWVVPMFDKFFLETKNELQEG